MTVTAAKDDLPVNCDCLARRDVDLSVRTETRVIYCTHCFRELDPFDVASWLLDKNTTLEPWEAFI